MAAEAKKIKMDSAQKYDFDDKAYMQKFEEYFEYYKLQKIYSDQDKASVLTSLKTELPVCFWFTQKEELSQELISKFEAFNKKLCENSKFTKLQWYQSSLFSPAFKSNISKPQFRKLDQHQAFHKWLTRLNELGLIIRQEEVSMVPPILLDLRPGLTVLDMCAAPGSKTCQIVHKLDRELARAESVVDKNGFVVANDSNFSRCHVLVKRLSGLKYPNIVVTNEKAQEMPNMRSLNGDLIKFDRVLCDVPCSGDGTVRKSPFRSLKSWSACKGLSLHNLQFLIAKRGFQLLKPGGVMVYSTCSLNPIENEAVVARLLNEFGPDIEVSDIENDSFLLKTQKGLVDWAVPENKKNPKRKNEENKNPSESIKTPLFPPKNKNLCEKLKKCIRILPHVQNTGGFFVAKLTKTNISSENGKIQPKIEKNPKKWANFNKIDAELEKDLVLFFGIDPSFFSENGALCHFSEKEADIAAKSRPKKIYFLPRPLEFLTVPNKIQANLIQAGSVVFRKNKSEYYLNEGCEYRILQNTIDFSDKFVVKRKADCTAEMALTLVRSGKMHTAEIKEDHLREKLKKAGIGSFILRIGDGKVLIATILSNATITSMVPKQSKEVLLAELENL